MRRPALASLANVGFEPVVCNGSRNLLGTPHKRARVRRRAAWKTRDSGTSGFLARTAHRSNNLARTNRNGRTASKVRRKLRVLAGLPLLVTIRPSGIKNLAKRSSSSSPPCLIETITAVHDDPRSRPTLFLPILHPPQAHTLTPLEP